MATLRIAWRGLSQTPVASLAATISLALAIGATTAIFSIASAVLLRPLPVPAPQTLVALASGSDDVTYLPERVWAEVARRGLFSRAAAWSAARFNIADSGAAEFLDGAWVSGSYFDTLEVSTVAGRPLQPADDRPGGGADGPVAVISDRLARRRFGSPAGALGQEIRFAGVTNLIVGVLPRSFAGLDVGLPCDLFLPLSTAALMSANPSRPASMYVGILARLGPGETAAGLTAAAGAAQPAIRDATMPAFTYAADRDAYLQAPLTVRPAARGRSVLEGRYGKGLVVLLAIAGTILLMACANIGALLLARAHARRRGFSLKAALGASRARLWREAFAESVLLSGIGGAAGLVLGTWTAGLLVRQFSTEAYTIALDLAPDWRVLLFLGGIVVATTVLFGTSPGLLARRASPLAVIGTARGESSRRRAGTALVVLQVALSIVLLTGTGLFLRTFVNLAWTDPGFDRDRVLIASVDVSNAGDSSERIAFYERAREAALSVPDVAAAAASLTMPAGNLRMTPLVSVPGGETMSPADRFLYGNTITPGWFETMGIPFRAGRDFAARDRTGAVPVAIVNEAFVRRLLPGMNPVGVTIDRIDGPGERQPLQIVGVVADSIYQSIRTAPPPTLYTPVAQSGVPPTTSFNLSVRPRNSVPDELVTPLTAAVMRVDPALRLTFRTLSDQVDSAFRQQRIVAELATFFGGLALLLASVGVYGVTAHGLAQRRRELGIRVALGATPRRIAGVVLRPLLVQLAAGSAVGVLLAVLLGPWAASLLVDVGARDGWTMAAAIVALCVVALVAVTGPSRRAARTDPAAALRNA